VEELQEILETQRLQLLYAISDLEQQQQQQQQQQKNFEEVD